MRKKEKKGRKNIKAVIRCKLVVFVRLCVSYWRLRGGGVLPTYPPQPQSGLDYHFTDRVPFPYMVRGFGRRRSHVGDVAPLKSILRRRELTDQISEGMMTMVRFYPALWDER